MQEHIQKTFIPKGVTVTKSATYDFLPSEKGDYAKRITFSNGMVIKEKFIPNSSYFNEETGKIETKNQLFYEVFPDGKTAGSKDGKYSTWYSVESDADMRKIGRDVNGTQKDEAICDQKLGDGLFTQTKRYDGGKGQVKEQFKEVGYKQQ